MIAGPSPIVFRWYYYEGIYEVGITFVDCTYDGTSSSIPRIVLCLPGLIATLLHNTPAQQQPSIPPLLQSYMASY